MIFTLLCVRLFVNCKKWYGGVLVLEGCTQHISGLGNLVVQVIEGVLYQTKNEGIQQIFNFIKFLSSEQCNNLKEEVCLCNLEFFIFYLISLVLGDSH